MVVLTQGRLALSGDIFGGGVHLVGRGHDAAKHPAMHGPTTKHYSDQNVTHTEVERL